MRRWILFLLPVLLLGGLIGWRLNVKGQEKREQDNAAQARKTAAPNVSVVEASRRDIEHVFEGIGSVDSPFNVKIASKITGRLEFLELREGDKVTVGQVIARIDPSELEAQVRQQQANVAEAQARLAQAELNTNPTSVGVTSQIRQQQAAVNSARANFNQVQQNYNAQVAAAQSSVTDAQARVDSATSAIANAQASLRSARANLANIQARYNRTNDLYKQGFIAAQDVDDARTQVDVQKGAVEVAQGQLDGAQSARESALAQKNAAQKQADIVATKGKSDIEASRAALRQAQASLDLARANTAQRPAFQANLDALRAAVAAAQAQLRNVQALLDQSILRSSITGYVTGRYMDPGTIATAGQPIVAIQALRQVYVTTSVPEDISRQVHEGMMADASFDALPNKTFRGKITQVNPAADPQSRQFTVRITLDNPQNLVKPGMFARVRLVTERFPNALVVPREAVKTTKDGPVVTVVDAGNVAHLRPVKTGPEDTTGIAIQEGVQPGEKVVTLSQMPLKEGQAVKTGGAAPEAAQPTKENGAK
jgi:HlyD family secretion protein